MVLGSELEHQPGGDSGGRIRSLKTNKIVDISGRDLPIRPDTGEMDAQTGQTQYGRNRDDWGNWFGGNNSVPAWHYVLPDQYIRRNPHFAVREPRELADPAIEVVVSDGLVVEADRVHDGDRRLVFQQEDLAFFTVP